MKNIFFLLLLPILLTACMTLSGHYVLTAHAPDGEDLVKGSRLMAEGGGIYSLRNALCSNYPGAVIIIRDMTTGDELKSESPYQCRGEFSPRQAVRHNEVTEMWDFDFDGRSWILGNSSATREQAIREYILEGDVIENWSELVSSHYLNVSPSLPAYQEILNQGGFGRYSFNFYGRHFAEHCESSSINMIEEYEDNIIFEWSHQGCPGHPPQHEIRRMQEVEGGTLSLVFTKKTQRLDDSLRQQWTERLRKAKKK